MVNQTLVVDHCYPSTVQVVSEYSKSLSIAISESEKAGYGHGRYWSRTQKALDISWPRIDIEPEN